MITPMEKLEEWRGRKSHWTPSNLQLTLEEKKLTIWTETRGPIELLKNPRECAYILSSQDVEKNEF